MREGGATAETKSMLKKTEECEVSGRNGGSDSQLSLRFLVTISRTRAGKHLGGASSEVPSCTVSFFSSDNTLSSSLWWSKKRQ